MTAPMPVYTGSLLAPEPWVQDAACVEVAPNTFFPTKGDHESARAAREVCRTCPVISDCLEYALRNRETDGVWGGLTPRQRKRISHTPTCRTCGAPIGHLSKQHRYCESCAAVRRAETKRAYEQKGAA